MTPASERPWPAGLWPPRPGLTLLQGDEGTGKSHWLTALAQHPQRPGVFHVGDPAAVPADAEQDVPQVLQGWQQQHAGWQAGRAQELIEAWQLTPHLGKAVFMLSTGTRRKLALVGAFASGADWLLLDQPYAALDLPSQRVLNACLQAVARQSRQVCVLADHAAPDARPLAAHVVLPPRP